MSLRGKSRKAQKATRSGTTTSRENRVGRIRFDQKSSRNLENKSLQPGNLDQTFLESAESRNNKAGISQTRIIDDGVKNSDDHGFTDFQISSKLRTDRIRIINPHCITLLH